MSNFTEYFSRRKTTSTGYLIDYIASGNPTNSTTSTGQAYVKFNSSSLVTLEP